MYSGITLINKRQRKCNLECSCRLWFFSRVFSPQCPTQLLPTHIEHIEEPILAKLLKQARLRFLQTVSADPWHGYHPASQGDCIVLFWRPSLRGWTQKSNTRLHRLHFVWERLFPRVGWSRCLRSKNYSLFRHPILESCAVLQGLDLH